MTTTLTCLSLCKYRILARRLSWQLLCWEKREPCPRRSWYVGLSEEDSCRHNLLLTSWYIFFFFNWCSSQPGGTPPRLVPVHPLEKCVFWDSFVYCCLAADSADACFSFLLAAHLFTHKKSCSELFTSYLELLWLILGNVLFFSPLCCISVVASQSACRALTIWWSGCQQDFLRETMKRKHNSAVLP